MEVPPPQQPPPQQQDAALQLLPGLACKSTEGNTEKKSGRRTPIQCVKSSHEGGVDNGNGADSRVPGPLQFASGAAPPPASEQQKENAPPPFAIGAAPPPASEQQKENAPPPGGVARVNAPPPASEQQADASGPPAAAAVVNAPPSPPQHQQELAPPPPPPPQGLAGVGAPPPGAAARTTDQVLQSTKDAYKAVTKSSDGLSGFATGRLIVSLSSKSMQSIVQRMVGSQGLSPSNFSARRILCRRMKTDHRDHGGGVFEALQQRDEVFESWKRDEALRALPRLQANDAAEDEEEAEEEVLEEQEAGLPGLKLLPTTGGGYYFNRSRKYYNHNVFVLTSGARVRILVPTEPDRDDSLRYINYRSAISENTSRAYRIANSQSRSLGGAATGSAIFGEQSAGSMQNVVQLMVERQNLTSSSRVIDVGSGLGKPNFHFACDPGVALSYGVEVDPARVHISQCDLLSILRDDEMRFQQAAVNGTDAPNVEKNCILEFGDIFNAVTFDPFTHIYMYDIGMPDWLFEHMASTLTVRPDVLDGLGDGQEGKGCNHRAAQQGDRGVPEEKTRQAQETAGSARV